MSNRLASETSPYLLQHKENPVHWYPWCDEAFERAKEEDKPIFLSIGYSACHWCHVIARESFEDREIAELLNQYFISVKVDREERPDIDSVYMTVCQAYTGSGGWPLSIFMTWEQKPFFAGTYFPKTSRDGMIGLKELLEAIHERWKNDRTSLLLQSDRIVDTLRKSEQPTVKTSYTELIRRGVRQFGRTYDAQYGGFGRAPKFPTAHNLIFLLEYFKRTGDAFCLRMAEHTLTQMYRGGLFDHIGFGFYRYSTDKKFLVPHFEKMLYDNALLILALCQAHTVTGKTLYLEVARKTAKYVLEKMTSPEGGFYSSQDADSEGDEGKFYLLTPQETVEILGQEEGKNFNRHFDIGSEGNFRGKNIPNLLKSDISDQSFDMVLPVIDSYRQKRFSLRRDEKILTSWNGLMIAALCMLYLTSKEEKYLTAAENANGFIEKNLCIEDTLFTAFCMGKRGAFGFLDDYAAYIFAQLSLYRATGECRYLQRAQKLCDKADLEFGDRDGSKESDAADGLDRGIQNAADQGGFYFYGRNHQKLILHPKEIYDGAMPSGNSLMAYNLVRLAHITEERRYQLLAECQLNFLAKHAAGHPSGHAMFLTALLEYTEPPEKVTAVPDRQTHIRDLPVLLPPEAIAVFLEEATEKYPLKNQKTTFYVCRNHSCLPPVNDLHELT